MRKGNAMPQRTSQSPAAGVPVMGSLLPSASTALAAGLPPRLLDRIEITDGCWRWTGRLNDGGYGLGWYEGRDWRMHRLTYLLVYGPIPEGLHLDHLCRVRSCVRPDHLEPVTPRTNVLRGWTVQHATCPQGHARTPDNTYVRSDGTRYCAPCQRASVRNRKRNRRAS